jgi:protein CpxP
LVVTLTAAAMIAALGGTALARDFGGFGGHGDFGPRMIRELDLSEAQREQVHEIMEAAKPQLVALREQIHANRIRLRETTPDDPNYSATVDEVSQAIAATTADMIRVSSRVRSDVYSILTPEQKAKAVELADRTEERMFERKERWREKRREHRRMHREESSE